MLMAMGCIGMMQEDTSEFLNGLQTAVEHIMLHQAGNPAKMDSRSKVCLPPCFLHLTAHMYKFRRAS